MSQNTDTLKFKQLVEISLQKGYLKNYSDLVKQLGWNLSVMSEVMNGKKNVPKHIYVSFGNWFATQLRNDDTNSQLLLFAKTVEALKEAGKGFLDVDLKVKTIAIIVTELRQAIRLNQDPEEIFRKIETELLALVKNAEFYNKHINMITEKLIHTKQRQEVFDQDRERQLKEILKPSDTKKDTKGDTEE